MWTLSWWLDCCISLNTTLKTFCYSQWILQISVQAVQLHIHLEAIFNLFRNCQFLSVTEQGGTEKKGFLHFLECYSTPRHTHTCTQTLPTPFCISKNTLHSAFVFCSPSFFSLSLASLILSLTLGSFLTFRTELSGGRMCLQRSMLAVTVASSGLPLLALLLRCSWALGHHTHH